MEIIGIRNVVPITILIRIHIHSQGPHHTDTDQGIAIIIIRDQNRDQSVGRAETDPRDRREGEVVPHQEKGGGFILKNLRARRVMVQTAIIRRFEDIKRPRVEAAVVQNRHLCVEEIRELETK